MRSRAHDRRRRPDPRSGRPHLFDPVARRAGPAGRGAGDGGDHGAADALDRSRRERSRPDGLPPGPAAAGLGLSSGSRPLGPGLHDLGRGGRAPGQSGRDPALERRQTLPGPPGGKRRRRARDDLRRPRRRCGSGSRLRRHGRRDPDRQADRLGRRLAHPARGGGRPAGHGPGGCACRRDDDPALPQGHRDRGRDLPALLRRRAEPRRQQAPRRGGGVPHPDPVRRAVPGAESRAPGRARSGRTHPGRHRRRPALRPHRHDEGRRRRLGADGGRTD